MSENSQRIFEALVDAESDMGALSITSYDSPTLVGWFERMLLIRTVEETVASMVESGEARCPCHLASGQEAVAVGVAAHLRPTDKVFGAHRSHGHYLAMGGGVEALLAEILGRATGCSHGMGGSMHLRSSSHGLVGTVPIVAATIPIATGAALAAKLDGGDAIAVCFFGDGAVEEGVFHESMNLASIWNLPIVFVCENNLFASHMHIRLRQPSANIARYADAHGIRSVVVDGNDVVGVSDASKMLVAGARARQGPALLEAVTYRWKGHVGHREDLDVGVARDSDLARWKLRDPIRRLLQALLDSSILTTTRAEEIRSSVESVAATALERARRAPFPEPDALYSSVYANGSNGTHS